MSASVSAMPGGQPSTTQPSAGPWLSPQVVTRKRWPKVLCDMARLVAAPSRLGQLRRAHHPGEEDQRLLQGGHVGGALRRLQAGADGHATLHGRGRAGRQEVVVAD